MAPLAEIAHAHAMTMLDRLAAQVHGQEARLNVIGHFREVITGYRDRGDPMMEQAVDAVHALAKRWEINLEEKT